MVVAWQRGGTFVDVDLEENRTGHFLANLQSNFHTII